MRNAFLAMSQIADDDSWCWNLSCTTCGCHFFRHGLHELAKGCHPDAPDWTVRQTNRRRFKSRPAALTFDEQVAVSSIVSEVEINDLASSCEFPDWLGYLGLVLHETVEAEESTRLLTLTLLPKLLVAIEDPYERKILDVKFADKKLLRWQDLEEFEMPIRPSRRSEASVV